MDKIVRNRKHSTAQPMCMILSPACISNYIRYKVWDEITNLSQKINGTTAKVWDRQVSSSHTLLGMWLRIQGGI